MAIFLFILAALIWVPGMILLIQQVRAAPEAVEDENGFRVIDRRPLAPRRARVVVKVRAKPMRQLVLDR